MDPIRLAALSTILYARRTAAVCTRLAVGLLLSCSAALAQQADSDLHQQLQRYQQAVLELNGSYTPGSAELHRGLADLHVRLGDVDAAIDAYGEALQALRIQEGLASSAQLELLPVINTLLYRQQQWERLDTHYHLAHSMARQLFGAGDPRTISAATRLASWKIRAWQANVYRPRGDRSVQEAAAIYQSLLERSDSSTVLSPQQRATWLSAQGLASFYSARHVANIPVTEFQQSAPVTSSFQQCVPLVMSVDGAQPSANACLANQNLDPEYYAAQQREKNNLVRKHLGTMRESFAAAIEALAQDPAASLEQRAQAVLHLGDANLLAEDYPRARRQYARAWEMLSAAPADLSLRQQLLDRPVRALQGILDELPFAASLSGAVLPGTLHFEVTETGVIENIEINAPPGVLSQEALGEIAVKLDQSVYRPRIVDGRPVRSSVTVSAADL